HGAPAMTRLLPAGCCLALLGLLWGLPGRAADADSSAGDARPIVLKPARVFDGVSREAHAGWVVVVKGDRIAAAGPAEKVKPPEDARPIELPGMTLLPGLIEAHSHVLLHPYNEATWNDQVLKEPLALRVCRATNHLRDLLHAGVTTIRDLGTEGAGY